MRIALDIPDGLAQLVSAGPLEPYPSDPASWRERALGGAEVVRDTRCQTRDGWRYDAVEDTIDRTVAFYRFFEYGCVVVVARPFGSEVQELLDSARPAWQTDGLVVCLAELFES